MQTLTAVFIAFILLLLPAHNIFAVDAHSAASMNTEAMIVRYAAPGSSDDERFGYIFELLHQIFEITRTDFGNYTIEPYRGAELSTQRYSMLLGEGNVVNVGWGPPGSVYAKNNSTEIKFDIFHSLLGYRVCLINSTASINLKSIQSIETLRHFKIGQGSNWSDIPIYGHNDVAVVSAPTFESLFPMLALNRYDCLALGINEIQTIYREKKNAYPFLAIDKNLLIYYEFPIYFYISQRTPKLAERIKLGLEKLQKNGWFDQLFLRYHGKKLAMLNLKTRNIVCLKSPYMADDDQCKKPVILPAL